MMDDESGESTEPMEEEVPLKELGETESGASRGIPDDAHLIAYSESQGRGKLRMLLVNRVLKTNCFRECALKIAVTMQKHFSAQNALNIVWRPGSARTRWPLGSLQRSPDPIGGFQDAYTSSWWRGTVVERRSLAGELSLSCS